MMKQRLFLASSAELSEDRKAFEIFVNRKNKDWVGKGVFIELIVWEDFLDAVSRTRLQDEYNKAITECDLFVMLFWTKVGQYTKEEFETAFRQFQSTKKPFIFIYFKDAQISTGSANKKDLMSLWAFQEKIDALEHFYTPYKNIDELKFHFSQQLDKLVAGGFIEFQPDRDQTAEDRLSTNEATLTGNGAIAQGQGATAVGAGGVSIGGKNIGTVNTVIGSGVMARGSGDALGGHSFKVEGNTGTIVTGTLVVANYIANAGDDTSKKRIGLQVAGYLRWLRSRTESIELRGIERAGGAPVVLLPLEKAYVPLRARTMSRPGDGREVSKARGLKDHGRHVAIETDEHEADVALNEVLGLGHRLVIIGGPGSGKTTVLLHMAWALASSLLSNASDPAGSRLGLTLRANELPLPILVPLASFARYRRHLPANAPAQEKTLACFISHHLVSKQADFNLPTDFFVQLLKDGRHVILMLDGLDEVANEDERAEIRQSVEELVSGRETMRVVVTCRSVAYRSARTALGARFREVVVQPLDFQQHIAPMVQQAYACIHPRDPALRADRTKDLLNGIARLEDERRARLGEEAEALIDSPLMVRLLLIVHVNNRTLPDERADLFDKAVNALLQVDYHREESDIRELSTDWKLYRDMAQHLALHMHEQGRDHGREIDEPALELALLQEGEFKPRIGDFLSHARQRGSVLEERDGAFRFIHLAIEEFLVARYLCEVIGRESRQAILAYLHDRLEDPWWREPILLLAGYMGVNAAKAGREFLSALAKDGETVNTQFAAAELAGVAALEWRESGASLRRACAERIVNLLGDNGTLENSRPVLRARAGDALSRLGDPRFDQDRFYLPNDEMLGFVRIPADSEFKIGTRRSDVKKVAEIIEYEVPDYETNDTATPTSEFYIGRYPVTAAQFRAFVEAKKFRIGDDDALRDPGSRPVRFVSWHEALAYCDWLNDLLSSPAYRETPVGRLVGAGPWCVALPSELEWEKAARGGMNGAVYSWGDTPDPNRANYADAEIGDTSATGCFPANGYGLYDMIGNVWEWTRSLWGTDWKKPDFLYPYHSADARREALDASDEMLRVVRGGSWGARRGNARCASRDGDPPDNRFSGLGFRVVLRLAPDK